MAFLLIGQRKNKFCNCGWNLKSQKTEIQYAVQNTSEEFIKCRLDNFFNEFFIILRKFQYLLK